RNSSAAMVAHGIACLPMAAGAFHNERRSSILRIGAVGKERILRHFIAVSDKHRVPRRDAAAGGVRGSDVAYALRDTVLIQPRSVMARELHASIGTASLACYGHVGAVYLDGDAFAVRNARVHAHLPLRSARRSRAVEILIILAERRTAGIECRW